MVRRLWLFPMHGEVKLRAEGARTRDGHLSEWFAKLGVDDIHVSSRPEPWPRRSWKRARHDPPPSCASCVWLSPQIMRGVSRRDRRVWWEKSSHRTEVWQDDDVPDGAVSWNPFAAQSIARAPRRVPLVLDLIDDWTSHHQFVGIRDAAERAYERSFALADVVFANSEGTLRLAQRFGRSDARLLLNGVDPQRFSSVSTAAGPTTIGYAGKISERIDVDLVRAAVAALPECKFVIAGLSNARAVSKALRGIRGLTLLGDVHYQDYAKLLSSWDIGWIPHRTGSEGEIGGDVIKLYEYRATGLPTFMTPIEGAGRGLTGVRVLPSRELVPDLVDFVRRQADNRVPRESTAIPAEMTWQNKAALILDTLEALQS